VAEQKSALAKHRLLGSTSKIIGANRMQSALEILREAQAEKLRQEAEELRILEEQRLQEETRVNKLIAKNKTQFTTAIESGNYKKLSKCLDMVDSMEPIVKENLRKEITLAQETFGKVSGMLTVKERQALEAARIETVNKLLIKLQTSETTADHNQLERELEKALKDEVLATAPLLQDEIQKTKNLIAKRAKKQQDLIAALDKALNFSDDDVSKKLKMVEKAKQALDEHVPKMDPVEAEEYEMRAGKCLRRLKIMEKLRLLIKKLNNAAIAEIKSYRDPGHDIEAVMMATFLISKCGN
jgi:hypothetical protein